MQKIKKTISIAVLFALIGGLSGCAEDSNSSKTKTVSRSSDLPMLEETPIIADLDAKLSNIRVEVVTEAAPVRQTTSPKPQPAIPQAPNSSRTVVSPSLTEYEQIQAIMAKYGVYPEAGTRFVIGSMPAGCYGADGCTQFSYYPDTGVAFDYTITIVPGQLTEYLLIHEIGHARGIRDECGADNFARSILGPVPTHYC